MWRELIARLEPDHTFFSPAEPANIAHVESTLGVILPDELKSLLLETDGVRGSFDLNVVWSVEDILRKNQAIRNGMYPDYAPFTTLLFFADAGNGDQFAYNIDGTRALDTTIWVWDHEDDSRRIFANSLKDYIEGWLSGTKGV